MISNTTSQGNDIFALRQSITKLKEDIIQLQQWEQSVTGMGISGTVVGLQSPQVTTANLDATLATIDQLIVNDTLTMGPDSEINTDVLNTQYLNMPTGWVVDNPGLSPTTQWIPVVKLCPIDPGDGNNEDWNPGTVYLKVTDGIRRQAEAHISITRHSLNVTYTNGYSSNDPLGNDFIHFFSAFAIGRVDASISITTHTQYYLLMALDPNFWSEGNPITRQILVSGINVKPVDAGTPFLPYDSNPTSLILGKIVTGKDFGTVADFVFEGLTIINDLQSGNTVIKDNIDIAGHMTSSGNIYIDGSASIGNGVNISGSSYIEHLHSNDANLSGMFYNPTIASPIWPNELVNKNYTDIQILSAVEGVYAGFWSGSFSQFNTSPNPGSISGAVNGQYWIINDVSGLADYPNLSGVMGQAHWNKELNKWDEFPDTVHNPDNISIDLNTLGQLEVNVPWLSGRLDPISGRLELVSGEIVYSVNENFPDSDGDVRIISGFNNSSEFSLAQANGKINNNSLSVIYGVSGVSGAAPFFIYKDNNGQLITTSHQYGYIDQIIIPDGVTQSWPLDLAFSTTVAEDINVYYAGQKLIYGSIDGTLGNYYIDSSTVPFVLHTTFSQPPNSDDNRYIQVTAFPVLSNGLSITWNNLTGDPTENLLLSGYLGSLSGSLINVSGTLNEVSGLQQSISGELNGVSGIQVEISGIQQSISGVQAEISGELNGVSGIQQEISGEIESISGIQQSISGVQAEVSGLQQSISGELNGVSGIQVEISGIQQSISGVQAEISGTLNEVSGLQQSISGELNGVSGIQVAISGILPRKIEAELLSSADFNSLTVGTMISGVIYINTGV